MSVPYILAEAHPLPRGVINWTWRRFAAYEGLLFTAFVLASTDSTLTHILNSSIMIGFMNLFITMALCIPALDQPTKLKWYGKVRKVAICLHIVAHLDPECSSP